MYLGFGLSLFSFGEFIIEFLGYFQLLNYDKQFLVFCCWFVVLIFFKFILSGNFKMDVECLFNLIGD